MKLLFTIVTLLSLNAFGGEIIVKCNKSNYVRFNSDLTRSSTVTVELTNDIGELKKIVIAKGLTWDECSDLAMNLHSGGHFSKNSDEISLSYCSYGSHRYYNSNPVRNAKLFSLKLNSEFEHKRESLVADSMTWTRCNQGLNKQEIKVRKFSLNACEKLAIPISNSDREVDEVMKEVDQATSKLGAKAIN